MVLNSFLSMGEKEKEMVRLKSIGLVCLSLFFLGKTAIGQVATPLCGKLGGNWNCLAAYPDQTVSTAGCKVQATCDGDGWCESLDVNQWEVNLGIFRTATENDPPLPGDQELEATFVICYWNTFCWPACEMTASGWRCKDTLLSIPVGGFDVQSLGPCPGGGGGGGGGPVTNDPPHLISRVPQIKEWS